MNDLRAALAAFAAADVTTWPGLPSRVRRDELAGLVDLDDREYPGDAGEPPTRRSWVAVASERYAGGLRAWLDPADPGLVLLLEGVEPVDAHGDFRPAPDLGRPDASLEVALGPFSVPDGERVYAERGLALRVNPGTGLLLGVLGFAPTTIEDYRTRLRPYAARTTPLPGRSR